MSLASDIIINHVKDLRGKEIPDKYSSTPRADVCKIKRKEKENLLYVYFFFSPSLSLNCQHLHFDNMLQGIILSRSKDRQITKEKKR